MKIEPDDLPSSAPAEPEQNPPSAACVPSGFHPFPAKEDVVTMPADVELLREAEAI